MGKKTRGSFACGLLIVPVTFAASNTTESKTLATLTGTVEARIWAVVTTAIGSNHTAAHLRLNDATNTPAITLATGTAMSSATVGSLIVPTDLAGVAIVLSNGSQARVTQMPTTNDADSVIMPSLLTAKNGATTTVEYRYTTTSTPTSGAATFYLKWTALSADGGLS